MTIKNTLDRYQTTIDKSITMVDSSDYRDLPDETLRDDLLIAYHALKAVENVLDKLDDLEQATSNETLNVIGMAIAQDLRQAIREGLL